MFVNAERAKTAAGINKKTYYKPDIVEEMKATKMMAKNFIIFESTQTRSLRPKCRRYRLKSLKFLPKMLKI